MHFKGRQLCQNCFYFLLLSNKRSILKGKNLLLFGRIDHFQKGIVYRNVNSKSQKNSFSVMHEGHVFRTNNLISGNKSP